MNLFYAKIISEDILQKLKPFCETDKIFIAGSIRREVPKVKDIEIVCLPKSKIIEQKNIFGETIKQTLEVDFNFVKTIEQLGTVEKGKHGGKYMKLIVKHIIDSIEYSIAVDIFTPDKNDFFRQLAIRTGSANYAHLTLARAWRKKGWKGIAGVLYRIEQCFTIDGKIWYPKKDVYEFEKPPVWENEKEFFNWIGIQYLEPKYRNQ